MGSRACGMGPPKSYPRRASGPSAGSGAGPRRRFSIAPASRAHGFCTSGGEDRPINTHRARSVGPHPRRSPPPCARFSASSSSAHGPHRRGHRLPGRHLVDRGYRGRHERHGRLPRRLGLRLPVVRVPAVPVLPVPRASACSRSPSAAGGAGRGARAPAAAAGRPVGRDRQRTTRAASGSPTPIAGSTRTRRGRGRDDRLHRRLPPEPVRSAPAHGRLTPSPTTPGGYPRPASSPSRSCLPMRTILVVEDEPQIAGLVRDYLEHAGFAVLAAADGAAALAHVPRPAARRARPRPRPAARRRARRRPRDPPRLHASRSSSSPPAATRSTGSPASSSARTTTWSSRSAPRSSSRGSGPCSAASSRARRRRRADRRGRPRAGPRAAPGDARRAASSR